MAKQFEYQYFCDWCERWMMLGFKEGEVCPHCHRADYIEKEPSLFSDTGKSFNKEKHT